MTDTIKAVIAAVVVAAILAGGSYVWWVRKALANAQARTAAAEQQASLNQQTGEIVDRYHTQTIVIQKDAEREVQTIQALPGADTPLDPANRAALCDALKRLRDGSEACSDPSAGEPAETL